MSVRSAITHSSAALYLYFIFSSFKNKFSYWLRARWRFLISIISFTFFGYSIVVFPDRLESYLTWISGFITCVSAGSGILQLKRESQYSLEFNPLDIEAVKTLRDSGWQTLARYDRLAVYLEQVNVFLPTTSVQAVVSPIEYELPQNVSAYRQVIMNKRRIGLVSNERKMGQETDLDETLLRRSDAGVVIYKTTYHNSLFTNDMALRRLVMPKTLPRRGDVLIDGTQFFVERNGRLSSLSLRKASNHMGVSTIAVFDDVEVPLVVQSARSLQSTGQVAPSGSGSVDWRKDIPNTGLDFIPFIASEIERELREELGLKASIKCNTLVVGYCRMVDRAGKPEYFGLTRVHAPISIVRRTLFERLFVQRHVPLEEIVGTVNSRVTGDLCSILLEKIMWLHAVCSSRRDISIITELNAKFAIDHINRARPSVEALMIG
ncbi:MAG TPA: hypothetical protein VNZ48_17925 [Xanthobacteraceae bacterium]|jgi:hypothetical protein|nr:hypothetical protein [Xanthobacteraceae bacterium]